MRPSDILPYTMTAGGGGGPADPSPAVYEAVAKRACVEGVSVERSRDPVLILQDAPGILDGIRDHREYACRELER